MGATNCPETPRQRMIGMMYLVLTAMLALNVSSDILKAFVTVDETLLKTNENFDRKVESSYAQFAIAKTNQPAKVGPYYDKAMEVKAATKKMIEFILQIRSELISEAEGKTIDEVKNFSVKDIEKKDNKDVPHNYFLGAPKKGEALRNEIEKYRAKLLSFVKEDKKADFDKKIGLDTKGPFKDNSGNTISWEDFNFGESILAATVTILNKMVGEVKNAEFDILSYLMTSITAEDFTFDNVSARVIPSSKLVFSGTDFEADIIVAAFDSKSTPEVYWKPGIDTATEAMIGSMTKVEGEGGMVKLKIPASGMGEQKFAGLIKMRAPDGTDKFYSFKESYSVAKSSATVAAEKMNVLYVGIDNPISVSAPVPPEKIRVGNNGGLVFKGSAGKYIVNPSPNMVGKEVNVTVSADFGGKSQNLGGTKFRIKNIPQPIIFLGTTPGGTVSASSIVNNPVVARAPDGFAYEMNWRVTSFRWAIGSGKNRKTGTASGNRFPGDLVGYINSAEPGTALLITEVKVSGTVDGKPINVVMDSSKLAVAVSLK